jgi:hypothetical protein
MVRACIKFTGNDSNAVATLYHLLNSIQLFNSLLSIPAIFVAPLQYSVSWTIGRRIRKEQVPPSKIKKTRIRNKISIPQAKASQGKASLIPEKSNNQWMH